MKKFLILLLALLMSGAILSAQDRYAEPYDFSDSFYIAVQGGVHVSASENAFAYRDEGKFIDLVKPQGYVSLGYDFNPAFGVRLSIGYGKEASAFNYKESYNRFRPYTYKGIETFADLVVNLKGLRNRFGPFNPKLYGGLGYARTWGMKDDFDDSKIYFGTKYRTEPNNCFGFRGGLIFEYDLRSGLGFFCDLGVEMFTDRFNGQNPRQWKGETAYYNPADPGFPFDVRTNAALGVVFHF